MATVLNFSNAPHTRVVLPVTNAAPCVASPIVIDYGSFQMRAGFAHDGAPRLVGRNLVGLPKTKREGSFVIVGDTLLETDAFRFKTRSPFDRGIPYQFDLVEAGLDYVFDRLGVAGDRVAHPILLTEPVCQPHHCRSQFNELLFECYGVPATCYGVDALFAYHEHVTTAGALARDPSSALLVSAGWAATHLLPVVDGRACWDRVYRLDVGGGPAVDHLLRGLVLRYPQHRCGPCFDPFFFFFRPHLSHSVCVCVCDCVL